MGGDRGVALNQFSQRNPRSSYSTFKPLLPAQIILLNFNIFFYHHVCRYSIRCEEVIILSYKFTIYRALVNIHIEKNYKGMKVIS